MHFSSDYWIFSLNEPIRTNDYRYESDMHAFIWSSLCFPRVLIFAQPMGKASSDNLGLSVFGYCIDVAILFRTPRTASLKHLTAFSPRYKALPLEHSLKRQSLPLFDRFHASCFMVLAVLLPSKGRATASFAALFDFSRLEVRMRRRDCVMLSLFDPQSGQ